MILQSLNDLYQRLSQDPKNGLPQPGFSLQKISFCVVLSPEGNLVGVEDARTEETDAKGKTKRIATQMLVPGQSKPTGSGLNPCFLWDNAAYVLGFKAEDPKPARTREAFEAFRKKHLDLEKTLSTPAFSAVCRFLEQWDPSEVEKHPEWSEYLGSFGVFKIKGAECFVHAEKSIRNWWLAQQTDRGMGEEAFCLITGARAPIARLHQPSIKGVRDAQSSGAFLVSFNQDAFVSFAKDQGFNSPVSETAAFNYANALNFLLRAKSFLIGDATTVFWTDKPTEAEAMLPPILAGLMPSQAQDEALVARLRVVLEKMANGTLGRDELGDARTRFYILGLSPNASRLSVRFWYAGSLGELLERFKVHFKALEIVREWDETSKHPDSEAPSLYQLLRETVRKGDDVPPLLGGALIRSILTGSDYPVPLVTGVLNRIRLEGHISYLRAAIVKSFLVRNCKLENTPIMLDKENTDIGYRLGRLFAVLEKTQADALGDVNATIVDRFFSSVSATPQVVLKRLIGLYQHHLKKLSPGMAVSRDKLMQEIMSGIPASGFPSHLDLKEQSLFAIGYYHQRKDFFTAKAEKEEPAAV